MDHIFMVFVLLWSSGLRAEETHDSAGIHDVRFAGAGSRCAGGLEMRLQGVWKPVDDQFFDWTLKSAAVVCRYLDCGSAVSTKIKYSYSRRPVWKISSSGVQTGSALREHISVDTLHSTSSLEIICSDSVRLVNGTTLCSGRLEVKSNQSWSSVCEAHFDQPDAEVVCRELGCGAPLVLRGLRHENANALPWTKDFRCRGNESVLLDCRSSDRATNACSSGKTSELTCSEPDDVRLAGGESRCAGRLELKLHNDWKPVDGSKWSQNATGVVCEQLNCGSVVSAEQIDSSARSVWGIVSSAAQSVSALRERVSARPWYSTARTEIVCSDLLFQPNISLSSSSSSVVEVQAQLQVLQVLHGSDFTISCSITPQYPGGSFQLAFTTTSDHTTHGDTLAAVDHAADFLYPHARHGHQGNYSCVYHIHVFSQNFSSRSQTLSLAVSVSPTGFTIRLVFVLLTLALCITAICLSTKATGRQKKPERAEPNYENLGGSRGGNGPVDGRRGTGRTSVEHISH